MRPLVPQAIARLFDGWDQPMISACLQGLMGEVLVDNPQAPQSALAKLGKKGAFGFLAGQPCLALLEGCRGEDIILVPQHQGWEDLIEQTYQEAALSFRRYATQKVKQFDIDWLIHLQATLPEDVHIQAIDEKYYDACLAEAWSQDLVANFDNYQQFERLGLGFVAVQQGAILSGASSYAIYHQGIEIEVDTHPEHRQKGLASAVAARLILACLNRRIDPNWDAHTLTSLKLAEKLGYKLAYDYKAYEIDWTAEACPSHEKRRKRRPHD